MGSIQRKEEEGDLKQRKSGRDTPPLIYPCDDLDGLEHTSRKSRAFAVNDGVDVSLAWDRPEKNLDFSFQRLILY
jgi:hypothetical protein